MRAVQGIYIVFIAFIVLFCYLFRTVASPALKLELNQAAIFLI